MEYEEGAISKEVIRVKIVTDDRLLRYVHKICYLQLLVHCLVMNVGLVE